MIGGNFGNISAGVLFLKVALDINENGGNNKTPQQHIKCWECKANENSKNVIILKQKRNEIAHFVVISLEVTTNSSAALFGHE